VKDGDQLPLGNFVVEVMHTPGHTPEHICLLVTDRTRAHEPWFALTGHTLMASLQRLKALPDQVEVLPGAYAGSVCGRRLTPGPPALAGRSGGKPSSTIGFERRHNAAFRIDPTDEFIRFMLQEIPPAPVGAAELRAWNSGRHAQ
jgi:glyoxylase-like metal-dependent hydrolase (beta-lactamase superfamily II)